MQNFFQASYRDLVHRPTAATSRIARLFPMATALPALTPTIYAAASDIYPTVAK